MTAFKTIHGLAFTTSYRLMLLCFLPYSFAHIICLPYYLGLLFLAKKGV